MIALYDWQRESISDHDVVLIESIARFSASALLNAQIREELHLHASQKDVLFEMSRQIATGLDLQRTLNRATQWISRLVETEMTLMWLQDANGPGITLKAFVGIGIAPDKPSETHMKAKLLECAAHDGGGAVPEKTDAELAQPYRSTTQQDWCSPPESDHDPSATSGRNDRLSKLDQ